MSLGRCLLYVLASTPGPLPPPGDPLLHLQVRELRLEGKGDLSKIMWLEAGSRI